MKYESVILKRLIDTYGVVGNPHYISEIIKEFIVRGKERYPNLFTYQSDWLAHIDEFGLNPSYTVSYTGQSIYAPNTLERPVKSAILSGQTLVNLYPQSEFNVMYASRVQVERGYRYTQTVHHDSTRIEIASLQNGRFKPNTTYYVQLTTKVNKARICEVRFEGGESSTIRLSANETKVIKAKVSSGQTLQRFFIYFKPSDGSDYVGDTFDILDLVVLEYQDGMENWDIPYFEGMQSVKLPVLKTTGKNLFDGELELGSYTSTGTPTNTTTNYRNKNKFIPIENEMFISVASIIHEYDGDKNFIKATSNTSVDVKKQLDTKTKYINFRTLDLSETQIMISKTGGAYEPFKSNILTVNEPIELRGIGDVKDTLDCLTGEVTERIGEIVLDGSEGWWHYKNVETMENTFCLSNAIVSNILGNGVVISNSYSNRWWHEMVSINPDKTIGNANNKAVYIIDKSCSTLEEFTNYLQQRYINGNPVIIQYPLETESIKTVDLTILDQNGENVKQLMSFNGGTHFNTKSSEGSPLPTVVVSVETDLEETLMVCSLEGNTM